MEFIEDDPGTNLMCGYSQNRRTGEFEYGHLASGNTVKSEGKKQTTPYYGGRVCDHWRELIPVGEHYISVSALADRPKSGYTQYPDMGVYVSNQWARMFPGLHGIGIAVPSTYKAIICDWPDFGVVVVNDLRWLVLYTVECIKAGMDVDIGCHGAHGRTGTLLACVIAYLEGCTADAAIKATRERHCKKAIETKGQENLVRAFCGEPEKITLYRKEWILDLGSFPALKAERVEVR